MIPTRKCASRVITSAGSTSGRGQRARLRGKPTSPGDQTPSRARAPRLSSDRSARERRVATPDDVEITSWHDFVEAVDKLSTGLSELPWFRGQSEDWPLRPRLLRHLRRRAVTDPAVALKIERAGTQNFRQGAHLYLSTARVMQLSEAHEGRQFGGRSIGLVAWWSVMRHHGAPTRLLDWTLSPYVAAYFASESRLVDGPQPAGVIYVLDLGALREVMDATYAGTGIATRMFDDLMTAT